MHNPLDRVPYTKNFLWREGYSSRKVENIRVNKVTPIPEEKEDNAIWVFIQLQILRDYYNRVLIINNEGCLYRDDLYNWQVKGAIRSRHKIALAGDISIPGIHSMEIYKAAKEKTLFKGFGIISAKSIHLDKRYWYWYKKYY